MPPTKSVLRAEISALDALCTPAPSVASLATLATLTATAAPTPMALPTAEASAVTMLSVLLIVAMVSFWPAAISTLSGTPAVVVLVMTSTATAAATDILPSEEAAERLFSDAWAALSDCCAASPTPALLCADCPMASCLVALLSTELSSAEPAESVLLPPLADAVSDTVLRELPEAANPSVPVVLRFRAVVAVV